MKILSSVTAGLLFALAISTQGATTYAEDFDSATTTTNWSHDGRRSNSIRLDKLSIHTIPEPSGALLFGAGCFLFLLRRRY